MKNPVKSYFRNSINKSVERLQPRISFREKHGVFRRISYEADKRAGYIDAERIVESSKKRKIEIGLTGDTDDPESIYYFSYVRKKEERVKDKFDGRFEDLSVFQAGKLALKLADVSEVLEKQPQAAVNQ